MHFVGLCYLQSSAFPKSQVRLCDSVSGHSLHKHWTSQSLSHQPPRWQDMKVCFIAGTILGSSPHSAGALSVRHNAQDRTMAPRLNANTTASIFITPHPHALTPLVYLLQSLASWLSVNCCRLSSTSRLSPPICASLLPRFFNPAACR